MNAKVNLDVMATEPVKPVQHWDIYRQGGSARIWYAALLSMDVDPTVKNRTQLKKTAPARYRIYLDRVNILARLHGAHASFPDMHHIKSGLKPKNKYVSLDAVARFAADHGWEGSKDFTNSLLQPTVIDLNGNQVHLSTESELDKLDQLPKGVRYATVRMGALLAVLEQCLLKEPHSTTRLLSNENLNIAEVARQISATVASAANRKQQKLPYGFRVDAISADLAQARRALDNLF